MIGDKMTNHMETVYNIVRKNGKNTIIECPEALRHIVSNPSVLAKQWWCFGASRDQKFNAIAVELITIRREIIKNYLKPYEIKDWNYKSYAVHPCDNKTCAHSWCCIRYRVDKVIIPNDNVII